MMTIAAVVTAMKNTERYAGDAPARNPKAAPGFRTWTMLKNPSTTEKPSWTRSVIVDPGLRELIQKDYHAGGCQHQDILLSAHPVPPMSVYPF